MNTKITIHGYTYKVFECGADDERFVKDGKVILFGECDYVKQEIRIFKDLTPERKRETLIHELTHAFINAYMPSVQYKGTFDEEDVCCFMATYGAEIIKTAKMILASDEVCCKPICEDKENLERAMEYSKAATTLLRSKKDYTKE